MNQTKRPIGLWAGHPWLCGDILPTYGDRQLQLAAIERLEEIETVRCMQPTLFRSEETCRFAARRDSHELLLP